MKILLSSCLLLAVAITSLEAAPRARRTVQLYKAGNEFGVKDIWKDCTSSSDPAKIVSITINPDPPQKGVDLNLTATVTLSEQVTSGNIEIDLKYGIFPLPSETTPLCDAVSCPINTGTQTLSIVEKIPSAAPGGHYTGHAYVKDQNGKELICIELDFHM